MWPDLLKFPLCLVVWLSLFEFPNPLSPDIGLAIFKLMLSMRGHNRYLKHFCIGASLGRDLQITSTTRTRCVHLNPWSLTLNQWPSTGLQGHWCSHEKCQNSDRYALQRWTTSGLHCDHAYFWTDGVRRPDCLLCQVCIGVNMPMIAPACSIARFEIFMIEGPSCMSPYHIFSLLHMQPSCISCLMSPCPVWSAN